MRTLQRCGAAALVLAIGGVFEPNRCAAQEAVASVSGRVVDVTGRGLQDVTVVAQSAVLAGPLTTLTSASGDYRLGVLPPGAYVLAFSQTGLVTVKQSIRLSVAEAAIVRIVMRPQDGFEGAVTVTNERQVFPPAWGIFLGSRHNQIEQLPVTGTARTISALSTDLPALPGTRALLIDGLPLQWPWRSGWQTSFAGPGPATLQEMSATPGRLPAGYGRTADGATELVSFRGGNRLTASFRGTFDSADLNADLLREARATEDLAQSAEYTVGGRVLPDRVWFFGAGRHLSQSVESPAAPGGQLVSTHTREDVGLGRVTVSLGAKQRLEGQWLGARQRQSDGFDDTRIRDNVFSGAYLAQPGSRLELGLRFTHEAEDAIPWSAGTNTWRVTAGTGFSAHHVTAGYDGTEQRLMPEAARQFRLQSQALFVNDQWLPGRRLSVDLGVRFDRHRATFDDDGSRLLSDDAVSPRVAATWRIRDAAPWAFTAGYGRYVFPLAERNPETVSVPHVDEWSVGISRNLGEQGYARLDITRRTRGDDDSTDSTRLDLRSENVNLHVDYRLGHYAEMEGQYTWSTSDLLPAHRLRIWSHTELIANEKRGLLTVAMVYSFESSVPGESAGPSHAGRLNRVDLSLSYRRRLPGTIHGDLFAAWHLLNVLNSVTAFHPERFESTSDAFTPMTLPRSSRIVMGIRF